MGTVVVAAVAVVPVAAPLLSVAVVLLAAPQLSAAVVLQLLLRSRLRCCLLQLRRLLLQLLMQLFLRSLLRCCLLQLRWLLLQLLMQLFLRLRLALGAPAHCSPRSALRWKLLSQRAPRERTRPEGDEAGRRGMTPARGAEWER